VSFLFVSGRRCDSIGGTLDHSQRRTIKERYPVQHLSSLTLATLEETNLYQAFGVLLRGRADRGDGL